MVKRPELAVLERAEDTQKWLVVGSVSEKTQGAGSQFPEAPKCKDTSSPIPKGEILARYPEKVHELSKRYDPGYEKFEKIKELVVIKGQKCKKKKTPGPGCRLLQLLSYLSNSSDKVTDRTHSKNVPT